MAASPAPAFLTQADFARRRKVSRKAVTGWKTKGLLVLSDDGLVDVEKTEWALDQRPEKYRGGVTHRPVKAGGGNRAARHTSKVASAGRAVARAETEDADDTEAFDPNDPNLPLPLALQRKENFLGLQRKQDFEKGERALVDRPLAIKLFFETARENRDAWLAWPARVAVEMADQLKVDARTLTTVLTAHVHQHLTELGEPHADL